MQMILNDAEAREYLRLKAIYDADVDLDKFKEKLDYFYYTQLIPIQAREDLERYPEVPKMSEENKEKRLKRSVESLLDIVSELRKELKSNQNNNKEQYMKYEKLEN